MNLMTAKSLFYHEGHEEHEDLEYKTLQAFICDALCKNDIFTQLFLHALHALHGKMISSSNALEPLFSILFHFFTMKDMKNMKI